MEVAIRSVDKVSITPFRIRPSFLSRRLPIEFVRYVLVAAVALAVDFSLLMGLHELFGWHYLFAAAVAFAGGLMTNYTLCVRWVFAFRMVNHRGAEFLVFTLIGLVGLALTEAILYIGTDLMGFNYRVSKFLAVGCVFFWNFSARKLILFSDFGGLKNDE